MATYYHNPKCTKSRLGLELLSERSYSVTIKEYIKDGFEFKELENIFFKLGKKPSEVIRSKDALFSELGLDKKTLSENEWIDTIIQNPSLMERPILINEKGARIGRPVETLKEILG